MTPQPHRPLRTALIVFALVMVVLVCGYRAGKDMAQRDAAAARAAATTS